MDALAFEAIGRIGDLLNSADENVQLKAARAVLGLAGVDPDRFDADARQHDARINVCADDVTQRAIERIVGAVRGRRPAVLTEDDERFAV
jgi:hypothetical protein